MPIVGINNQKRDAEFVYERNVRKSATIAQKQEAARLRLASAVVVQDADGNAWKYVVEEDGTATVLDCRAAASRVEIPAEFGGVPVRSIEADAFKENACLEELVCADGIEAVGLSAFRRNRNLRRIVLPGACADFDATWLRDCPKLEELVLPGGLETVGRAVTEPPALRSLTLGPGARAITPGIFEGTALARISVAAGNPVFKSDGCAVYSADGERLVVLAAKLERYEVAPGTRVICEKALGTNPGLVDVVLPDGVEELREYAFTRAGIARFEAPRSLRVLGARAFYNCKALTDAVLNEGLEEIGENAFGGTPIARLTVPATVRTLGGKLADDGRLTYAGSGRTFDVAPGSAHFMLDEQGGMYRKCADGNAFVRLMDPAVQEYEVAPGTRVIEERAFYRHLKIRRVILPEGLEEIGEAAFRAAEALEEAELPSTMRELGPEAFFDTSISSLRIGPALARIGSNAIVTKGAHKGTGGSIRAVAVDEGNEHFYTCPGLLMERRRNGRERVVLGIDGVANVEIPLATTSVAAYAMNGLMRIRSLRLSDRIIDVEMRGLAIQSCLDLLHIDFKEPIEGHGSVEFSFPRNDNTRKEISLAFGMSQFLDVESIASHYDSIVLNTQSHNAAGRPTIGLYQLASRAVQRLLDPLFLLPVNRSMYDNVLRRYTVDVCEQVARHDDRRTIDGLIELGYLTKDNIADAIERVGALQDAAMTGYLLEKKRELVVESGGSFMDDFEL